jgi:uncharacterized protein YjiS (DUF1127 family)
MLIFRQDIANAKKLTGLGRSSSALRTVEGWTQAHDRGRPSHPNKRTGHQSTISHRGSGILAQIAETLHVWRERVRSRREVTQLSDRDLRDVGISRSDIVKEAEKPFWRA